MVKQSRKGNTHCPLCSKKISRSNVGKHLRNVHGGNNDQEELCPWPDCGMTSGSKNEMKTHLYAHTDVQAIPCPHFKESPNGEWIHCRKKLFNQSKFRHHRRIVHGWDMYKNESVDPWMEPFAPFDCDIAQGGNIEGSEVENSGLVSNRVTRPKPEKRGVTSQVSTIGGKVDVPDLLPTLEGLIPIKAEDIDDSELLNYSASHKNKSSVSASQKKLKAISTV